MKQDRLCAKCMVGIKAHHRCLWGQGAKRTVMLVSDCPSYNDDFENVPLSGRAGDLLQHILYKLGVDREDLYITNLIKCHPPKDKLPKGPALRDAVCCCLPYLQEEMQEVKPKVIVPMGSLATKILTGHNFITRVDGMTLTMEGGTYVPSPSLSAVLQSPSVEKNVVMALASALTLAGLKLRQRGLGVIFNYELGGLE